MCLTNACRWDSRDASRAAALATKFFGETLPTFVRRLPWFGRGFARLLFGLVGPEVLGDPARAAETRPVFEIRAADAG